MCSIVTENSSPPRLTLEQLEEQICQLAAHLAAATCRWLLLIAQFDARDGWAEWGVRSCAHWLSWRCSISPRSAREHVRVARCLGDLALIRDSFTRGELTYSKVRALTRVATRESEAELLEIARHATGSQLDKLVRGYRGALSATIAAAELAHESRFLRWCWYDDGSLRIDARLTPDEGAMVLAALRAAEEPPDPDTPNAGHVRADALVAVARAALADGLVPHRVGGDPCELVVHVDSKSLAAERISDRCGVAGGPALAPETARRLGCDAALVRVVERDGEPLSVGRRTRTIPAALRRSLRSRDRGCRFPGCDHERFLHAHHIKHWAHGGPTSLANLVQLCSYHHRLVHEGGFGVERLADGRLRFRRPNGQLISSAPESPPARGAGLVRQHARAGLRLHGDTCRPLSAGDRLDYSLAVELLLRQRASPPP